MSDILNKLALSQVCLILRDTLKNENLDIALPEDLPDKMYKTLCQESGSLVSVRDVMPCRIPLPFMPDRIDYKIGKGCCDEILKSDGLFVPCSRHCEEGSKCSKHLKEPSGCGDYAERYAAWNKKELYCVVIGEKEIKEKPYGTYLHAKSLDSIAIEEELCKWGIPLRLDFTQWRAPPKPLKKNRGRKAVLKVTPSDSDSEQFESDDELKGVKAPEEAPKAEVESETEEPVKKRPAPKKKKEKTDTAPEEKAPESDAGSDLEDPEAVPPVKEKRLPTASGPPKKKKEKVKGTPLDAGELKKEDMEEKAPKKGKYRGKKESLVEGKWNDEDYLIKEGRYYAPESLELVAWTNASGEIILL
jgi:hypothetical protein